MLLAIASACWSRRHRRHKQLKLEKESDLSPQGSTLTKEGSLESMTSSQHSGAPLALSGRTKGARHGARFLHFEDSGSRGGRRMGDARGCRPSNGVWVDHLGVAAVDGVAQVQPGRPPPPPSACWVSAFLKPAARPCRARRGTAWPPSYARRGCCTALPPVPPAEWTSLRGPSREQTLAAQHSRRRDGNLTWMVCPLAHSHDSRSAWRVAREERKGLPAERCRGRSFQGLQVGKARCCWRRNQGARGSDHASRIERLWPDQQQL